MILDWDNAAQATLNTLGIRESLMAVAKNFSDIMNFAISNKRDYKYELQNCGHDQKKIDSQEPIVCIFKEEDRFRMRMSYSNEAFAEFIERVLDGREERYLKTEPVPDNTGRDVIDVVSTTMDDVVFRSNRDVFLLFYKPDCRHCQDLMPVWESLGAALRTEQVMMMMMIMIMRTEQVDVARMNLRDNEIPPEFKEEMFVKEYPTMFLKVTSYEIRNLRCRRVGDLNIFEKPCSMSIDGQTVTFVILDDYLQPSDPSESSVQYVGRWTDRQQCLQ